MIEQIIAKLDKDEISYLCDYFDNGNLIDLFYEKLFPIDAKNNPDKYRDCED